MFYSPLPGFIGTERFSYTCSDRYGNAGSNTVTVNVGALLTRSDLFSVGTLLLNEIRTLGAHRFIYDGKREVTFVEQLVDSVNYPRNPLITGLWLPGLWLARIDLPQA